MSDYEWYLIQATELAKVERVMRRLYTETRLNGDEMRDLAHTLRAFVDLAKQIPMPDTNTRD